jgi:hypothetical protein
MQVANQVVAGIRAGQRGTCRYSAVMAASSLPLVEIASLGTVNDEGAVALAR